MSIIEYRNLIPQINNGTFKFYNFYNLDIDLRTYYGIQYYKNTNENVEEIPQILNTIFLDIESYRIDKTVNFSFEEALHPISAISFNFNNDYYSYFLNIHRIEINTHEWEQSFKNELVKNEYLSENDNIHVIIFNDELTLIKKVWEKIKEIDPVILSGWNSHKFDYPYIFKRLISLLNEQEAINIISTLNHVKFNNKSEIEIADYVIADLMYLYMPRDDGGRNYGRKQLSYSLNYIADEELGLQKFEYKDTNIDLDDFYDKDPKGYAFYNLIDTILCSKLNKKLKHIELNNNIRRTMKCTFGKSLIGASAIFDSFVINNLNKKIRFGIINQHEKFLPKTLLSNLPSGIIKEKTKELLIPSDISNKDYINNIQKYDGAYVTKPVPGIKNKGLTFSLDATSMYPSMMVQYNISFDTYKLRVLPGTVYKLLNILNTTLGKVKEIPPAISNSVFLTINNYINTKKNLQRKAETHKILHFSAMFLLSKLYESGLSLSKIMNPTNNTEQYLLSFYLLHLIEIINLAHPNNYSYNDVIYTYLFDESNFHKKYPEIYILNSVNTPNEFITKLSSIQLIEILNKYIITITGDCFTKHDEQIGLFTNMLEDFSSKRKKFQAKMEEYPEGSDQYQLYDSRQNTTKIVMNSNYGVQGLKSFRFSNAHLAQCITTQGKLTIKLAQYISDTYLISKYK